MAVSKKAYQEASWTKALVENEDGTVTAKCEELSIETTADTGVAALDALNAMIAEKYDEVKSDKSFKLPEVKVSEVESEPTEGEETEAAVEEDTSAEES